MITPEHLPVQRAIQWSVCADAGTQLERLIAHTVADLAELEAEHRIMLACVARAREVVAANRGNIAPKTMETYRYTEASAREMDDRMRTGRVAVLEALDRWGRELSAWRRFMIETAKENPA